MNTQKNRGQPSIPVPTLQQLAELGLGGLAYVRPVVIDGQAAYAIFAANGQQIGLAPDRAVATAAIVQHEMVPVSVH